MVLVACFTGGCMASCCPKVTPKTDGGAVDSGPADSGASCETAGAHCAQIDDCCPGLSCDPTSGTCLSLSTDGGPDSGCTPQPTGGSCVSLADCGGSDVCLFGSDGGVCGPSTAPAPSLACSPVGQSCATLPCCGGECVSGTCAPYAFCGTQAANCATDNDCCNGFKCATPPGASTIGSLDGGLDAGVPYVDAGLPNVDAGLPAVDAGTLAGDAGTSAGDSGTTVDAGEAKADAGTTVDAGTPETDAGSTNTGKMCIPVCGGEMAPCKADSDCCTQQGMFCLGTGNGNQTACFPQLPTQPLSKGGVPTPCGGPCSAFECQLGAACTPPASQSQTDPCAAAGLVCDLATNVCRAPNETEACVPGGPACQPIPNSTVADIQCSAVKTNTGSVNLCLQPCKATSDCVDPDKSCTQKFCFFNQGCKDFFQSCASSGAADGLCMPINNGGTFGLCFQTNLDGGAAGSPCLAGNGNRQLGRGCDINDYCGLNDFCQPICNAGTGGSPSCSASDGGLTCIADQGETGNQDDFGTCTTTCDFTASNGGGCVPPDGTQPEKCFPELFLSLPDSTKGVCFPALPPSQQIATGKPCDPSNSVDQCVPGALCLNNGSCDKICDAVGQTGQAAGCPGTQACHGFSTGNGGTSKYTGYCQ